MLVATEPLPVGCARCGEYGVDLQVLSAKSRRPLMRHMPALELFARQLSDPLFALGYL
jgi:hypothetical protein